MKKLISIILVLIMTVTVMTAIVVPAAAESTNKDESVTSAAEESSASQKDNTKSVKAIAAAIAIGLATLGGAVAMGLAIAKTSDAIARQPGAVGDIRGSMMLGLVFVETAIIYALIIAILIIFVL